MKLDPAHAEALLLRLKEAIEPAVVQSLVNEVFDFLRAQLEALREQANGYPRVSIPSEVWMSGSALACMADALVDELHRRQLPKPEEFASRLATALALQVKSHYPQEIFPRVLRNARCCEAIGDTSRAIGNYQAILGDFVELELEQDWLEPGAETTDDWNWEALDAAHAAATRLIELGVGPEVRWRTLCERIDQARGKEAGRPAAGE